MGRATKLIVAAALLLLAAAPVARAELTAESMYQPGTVVSIKLALPEESVKKLNKEPKKYVKGTFSLAETEGAPGTEKAYSPPLTVGIKLKGGLGSLRTLGEKAAFKISFEKYVEPQTFLGLKRMTLNNMVQDASMLHETMAYELFRANRVQGSHTGFAYLHVNLGGSEENFGMHLNIESVDDVAMAKRFGEFRVPPQHLYAGEYGADVTKAAETKLEVSEGEEGAGKEGDLEALVAAVEGAEPADFSERVSPFADLQEMVHEWAVEKYIGHWDGYAGQQGSLWPNNYYLYSSPTGVFQMLPWGTDQTWADRLSFDGAAGVLFDDCLADASCATMYRRALRELLASVPAVGLDALAARTAALLEPWQALEEAPRRGAEAAQVHSEVEAARSFANGRPGELEAFLQTEPPEPPAKHVTVSLQPGSIPPGGGGGTVTAMVTGAADEPIFGDQLEFAATDPGIHLGPAVDEGEGVYTASFSGSAAPGPVTVTATDRSAGIVGTAALTAEAAPIVTLPVTPTPAPAGPSGANGAGSPASPAATAPPRTPVISWTRRPGRRTVSRRPLFVFGSDLPGSTFVCRLGDGAFRPCASPYRLPRLSRGHHSFSVAAVGPEGTRGDARRYEFVVSIRRRTRVPD